MTKAGEYPDVMTISEVCEVLRVCDRTVYEMVRKGRLPFFRAGRQIRFSRAAIMEGIRDGFRAKEG